MPRPIPNTTVLVINILVVLGSAPLWAEFQINSFTISAQAAAAVSHSSAGGFVVVWESRNQDGSSDYGIFGQRFDSGGMAQGGEFQINSFTTDHQRAPRVSHDSAGGFVVAWNSYTQDGSYYGIFGQRFDSGGMAQGGEFQINSFTSSTQFSPAVSHDSAGGFVVAWSSYPQDGSLEGIFGQRFDSGGSPLGGEFQINSFTTSTQWFPAVSHDSAGGFVVVWHSYTQDGSAYGVFGQRFDSGGMAQGGEFQINSFTTDHQRAPSVSHDSAGGFVVVWHSGGFGGPGQDGSDFGIFGQRFDSGGTPLGGEFQINSTTIDRQYSAAVSHDSVGGFVVVWHSYTQDGSGYGVFGQRFDSGGTPLGGEFQINSFTTSSQEVPVVSHDSAGGFVVVWDSLGQDGSSFGVFGQRFPTVSIDDPSLSEGNSGSSNALFTVSLSSPADGSVQVDYTTADGTASSASDFTSTSGTAMIASGASQTMIPVSINGDTLYEHDESFSVNLSNPSRLLGSIADPQGIGTILNDDAPPELSINDISAAEGNSGTTDFDLTVDISVASGVDAEVDFMTSNGTAEAGTDYTSASGTLIFPAMTTDPQHVFVTVIGDSDFESDETFFVDLDTPVDASILDGQAQGTILNDDGNFLILTGPAAGGGSNIRRYQGS